MRFAAKIFLSTLAFLSIILALGTFAINQKLGSPESTRTTVQSLLSNDEVALAAGTILVNKIYEDIPPQAQALINSSRYTLNRQAGKIVQRYSSSVAVAAGQVYEALLTDRPTKVNLRALIVATATALHSLDRHIPVKAGLGNGGIVTIGADNSSSHHAMVSTLKSFKKLMNMWWVFLLIALGFFVGISFFDKRSGIRAWRWPGYIMLITGGSLLFLSSIVPKLASSKVSLDRQDIFNAASGALNGGFMAAAVGATLAGAVLVLLSFVMKS